MAEYYVGVWWGVCLIDDILLEIILGEVFLINAFFIIMRDVVVVCKELKNGRVYGVDGLVAVIWKCLFEEFVHLVVLWIL